MKTVAVRDLSNSVTLNKNSYLDEKYILLTPETPVSNQLIKLLVLWDFRQILSDGEIISKVEETAKEAGENAEANSNKEKPNLADNEREKVVSEFYSGFTQYVDSLFTRYVTKNELPLQDISAKIQELCNIISENRRFILRIQDPGQVNRNYLVNHTVKSTILSIVLGSYLKLIPARLVELGTSALLHEIGMVRLPPQLYMNDRPLTPQEKKNITAHPIIGYTILKDLKYPLAISLGALEHHERMNGAGYPRQLTGDKISLYARIIAVACSYDAVVSSRPYKAAKDGYNGMLDILKNPGKMYDESVIKALVFSLSIYPIGSYVLLSTGQIAQVADVNPENPRLPIVVLVSDKGANENQIKTDETKIKITRLLSKSESEAVAKAQNKV